MKPPTPCDLDLAPELAILAALESIGRISRTAIISARAELRDPETGQQPLFSEDETGTVRTLITLTDALLEQIQIYRDRIDADNRRAGYRPLRDI